MVIQIVNILSGILLAAPMIKGWVGVASVARVEKLESRLNAFRGAIGIAALVLGVLALVERVGIVHFGLFSIGSSFPQAIPSILSGLLLAPHLFAKYPAVSDLIKKIEPHAEWVGVLGIAVGLGSLLFGCVAPVCYSL